MNYYMHAYVELLYDVYVYGLIHEMYTLMNYYWRWEKPQEGGGWIVFLETSSFTV